MGCAATTKGNLRNAVRVFCRHRSSRDRHRLCTRIAYNTDSAAQFAAVGPNGCRIYGDSAVRCHGHAFSSGPAPAWPNPCRDVALGLGYQWLCLRSRWSPSYSAGSRCWASSSSGCGLGVLCGGSPAGGHVGKKGLSRPCERLLKSKSPRSIQLTPGVHPPTLPEESLTLQAHRHLALAIDSPVTS